MKQSLLSNFFGQSKRGDSGLRERPAKRKRSDFAETDIETETTDPKRRKIALANGAQSEDSHIYMHEHELERKMMSMSVSATDTTLDSSEAAVATTPSILAEASISDLSHKSPSLEQHVIGCVNADVVSQHSDGIQLLNDSQLVGEAKDNDSMQVTLATTTTEQMPVTLTSATPVVAEMIASDSGLLSHAKVDVECSVSSSSGPTLELDDDSVHQTEDTHHSNDIITTAVVNDSRVQHETALKTKTVVETTNTTEVSGSLSDFPDIGTVLHDVVDDVEIELEEDDYDDEHSDDIEMEKKELICSFPFAAVTQKRTIRRGTLLAAVIHEQNCPLRQKRGFLNTYKKKSFEVCKLPDAQFDAHCPRDANTCFRVTRYFKAVDSFGDSRRIVDPLVSVGQSNCDCGYSNAANDDSAVVCEGISSAMDVHMDTGSIEAADIGTGNDIVHMEIAGDSENVVEEETSSSMMSSSSMSISTTSMVSSKKSSSRRRKQRGDDSKSVSARAKKPKAFAALCKDKLRLGSLESIADCGETDESLFGAWVPMADIMKMLTYKAKTKLFTERLNEYAAMLVNYHSDNELRQPLSKYIVRWHMPVKPKNTAVRKSKQKPATDSVEGAEERDGVSAVSSSTSKRLPRRRTRSVSLSSMTESMSSASVAKMTKTKKKATLDTTTIASEKRTKEVLLVSEEGFCVLMCLMSDWELRNNNLFTHLMHYRFAYRRLLFGDGVAVVQTETLNDAIIFGMDDNTAAVSVSMLSDSGTCVDLGVGHSSEDDCEKKRKSTTAVVNASDYFAHCSDDDMSQMASDWKAYKKQTAFLKHVCFVCGLEDSAQAFADVCDCKVPTHTRCLTPCTPPPLRFVESCLSQELTELLKARRVEHIKQLVKSKYDDELAVTSTSSASCPAPSSSSSIPSASAMSSGSSVSSASSSSSNAISTMTSSSTTATMEQELESKAALAGVSANQLKDYEFVRTLKQMPTCGLGKLKGVALRTWFCAFCVKHSNANIYKMLSRRHAVEGGEGEYEVEKVLRYDVDTGAYAVRWMGYPGPSNMMLQLTPSFYEYACAYWKQWKSDMKEKFGIAHAEKPAAVKKELRECAKDPSVKEKKHTTVIDALDLDTGGKQEKTSMEKAKRKATDFEEWRRKVKRFRQRIEADGGDLSKANLRKDPVFNSFMPVTLSDLMPKQYITRTQLYVKKSEQKREELQLKCWKRLLLAKSKKERNGKTGRKRGRGKGRKGTSTRRATMAVAAFGSNGIPQFNLENIDKRFNVDKKVIQKEVLRFLATDWKKFSKRYDTSHKSVVIGEILDPSNPVLIENIGSIHADAQYGLFAIKDIPNDTMLFEYVGVINTVGDSERPIDHLEHEMDQTTLMTLNGRRPNVRNDGGPSPWGRNPDDTMEVDPHLYHNEAVYMNDFRSNIMDGDESDEVQDEDDGDEVKGEEEEDDDGVMVESCDSTASAVTDATAMDVEMSGEQSASAGRSRPTRRRRKPQSIEPPAMGRRKKALKKKMKKDSSGGGEKKDKWEHEPGHELDEFGVRRQRRVPNVRFREILVNGWPHIFAVTCRDVEASDELLTDYSKAFWIPFRKIITRHKHLTEIKVRLAAEHRRELQTVEAKRKEASEALLALAALVPADAEIPATVKKQLSKAAGEYLS